MIWNKNKECMSRDEDRFHHLQRFAGVLEGGHTVQADVHAQFDDLLCHLDRKSTRLNSSHSDRSRMPSSA